jgi:hypothetical protein
MERTSNSSHKSSASRVGALQLDKSFEPSKRLLPFPSLFESILAVLQLKNIRKQVAVYQYA